jgi:hypothetical protein
VYEKRALLGLFLRVPANGHQGFNHPIKRVHIVVPNNQLVRLVFRYGDLFFKKGFGMLFCVPHPVQK